MGGGCADWRAADRRAKRGDGEWGDIGGALEVLQIEGKCVDVVMDGLEIWGAMVWG